jgi:hypothetical protein
MMGHGKSFSEFRKAFRPQCAFLVVQLFLKLKMNTGSLLWLKPVTLATREVEITRITVRGQSQAKSS